jgi:hypothetical protein
LIQVLPPSVDRKILLFRLVPQPLLQPLPLFSSIPAMYTSPVTLSPVICTSRMKLAVTGIGACQVVPLSLE